MSVNTYVEQARAARIAARAAGTQPTTDDTSIVDKAANHAVKAVAAVESTAKEAASNYLDMRLQMKAERLARGCRW
jgi:hypothetical protein